MTRQGMSLAGDGSTAGALSPGLEALSGRGTSVVVIHYVSSHAPRALIRWCPCVRDKRFR
jgi:hypothetical protein